MDSSDPSFQIRRGLAYMDTWWLMGHSMSTCVINEMMAGDRAWCCKWQISFVRKGDKIKTFDILHRKNFTTEKCAQKWCSIKIFLHPHEKLWPKLVWRKIIMLLCNRDRKNNYVRWVTGRIKSRREKRSVYKSKESDLNNCNCHRTIVLHLYFRHFSPSVKVVAHVWNFCPSTAPVTPLMQEWPRVRDPWLLIG